MQTREHSVYPIWAVVGATVMCASLAASCGNEQDSMSASPSSEPVVLPTHSGTSMEALTSGHLVERSGCIELETDAGENWLVVWPAGWTAERDDSAIVIRDSTGAEWAEVGSQVELGGGWSDTYPPNPACESPNGVWIASGK